MATSDNISSIFFSKYKSFSSDTPALISPLKHVTVLLGKNNCGKSSIIDVISMLSDRNKIVDSHIIDSVGLDLLIDSDQIIDLKEKIFSYPFINNISNLPSESVDKIIRIKKKLNISSEFNYCAEESSENFVDPKYEDVWNSIASNCNHAIFNSSFYVPFIDSVFRRLDADRDIVAEPPMNEEFLNSNGDGATNLIQRILNRREYPEEWIENELLEYLNKIMYPDAEFSRILIQLHEAEMQKEFWEIYLQEKNSNRFPLSKTGSGLKTIILILLNLMIIPKLEKNKNIVYAFEEIENNLHPALQRRIFDFIYNWAVEHNVYIFLTTHSHIAINSFFGKEKAQLFRVEKENNVSTIHNVENYIDKIEILNDLDVRASDLFQSNGIIWVEGPSDRIYIKKWLELLHEPFIYTEGIDYQFLYYGGKLLSHYSGDDDAAEKNLIGILTTNRNSAIIIDSDKREPSATINTTKHRILEEFQSKDLFCWITEGKEVENYIPYKSINSAFSEQLDKQCDIYELFPDYISGVDSAFSNHKVAFANKVAPEMKKEDIERIMDLKIQINKLYEQLTAWNPRKMN